MAFDLVVLTEHIRDHQAAWHALGLRWTHREISPNYGKATTGACFDAPGWLGAVSVWATGEAELETVRVVDGSGVNKHYDLADASELEVVLSELIDLIRDGLVPPDAFTYAKP